MADGELFNKLDAIRRSMRNKPHIRFGGIQHVLSGGFFQRPSVATRGKASKFAFDADTWSAAVKRMINVTHASRQKDHEFADVETARACQVQRRQISVSSSSILASRRAKYKFDNGIDATELFSTLHEVEGANWEAHATALWLRAHLHCTRQ
ncbi:uncharacterized protein V1518DRAFT_404808 [Limtongia smithiae]|uniref:uncharacterized protein n=1 Tax=Limtongia smithiae TaxID=1125753 RepID=UPI0034CF48F3